MSPVNRRVFASTEGRFMGRGGREDARLNWRLYWMREKGEEKKKRETRTEGGK